jgi:hypothetical protein
MKVIETNNGITKLEHDEMDFKIFDDAIGFKEECIGLYIDKQAYERKVMRDSVYGVQVIEALNAYYKKQWGCKG